MIRIIANLSINQDIGPLIAANETCVDLLMQVLGKSQGSEMNNRVLGFADRKLDCTKNYKVYFTHKQSLIIVWVIQ